MEEVYFVLGMVAVLLVLGVMIVFTVRKKIQELEKEIQFLERSSQDVVRDLHLRIENEVRDLKFHNNETILGIERELSELQFKISKTKRVVKN